MTVVAESPSPTLDGFTDRLTAYVSSSVNVRLVPVTVMLVPLPDTVIVSLPSTDVSCVGVRVKVPVPLLAFAEMVTVKSFTSV